MADTARPSPAPEETRTMRWLALVREAVRGTERDLTRVSIRRAVVLLAIPTVLEMAMESLLTVVDIFFVSKLGSEAVATVGLTESLLSFVYAIALGLSSGATAIISRRTGEKNADGAATSAVQAIGAAVVVGLVIGAAGVLLAPRFLAAMGASPNTIGRGAIYTRIMLGGNVSIVLLFVINGILRSAGDAAAAMRSLWIANLLNMVLAPCLIFGVGPIPALGLAGAAVATTVSRGVGVGYQGFLLAGGRARIMLAARHLRVDVGALKALVRVASTGALQVLVETTSWLGLMRIVSSYGDEAVAGYTVAMRIFVFAMLPSWGLASAAATLVGQNLGAKRPDRAAKSVQSVARYNVLVLTTVGAAFAAAPGFFVGLIVQEPVVHRFAATCLRIVAVGFPFFGYGMAMLQAFNGAGDTRTPVVLNVVSFWLFKIPLAYLLAQVMGLGPRGVFFAVSAAYTAQAVAAGLLFRSGKWQSVKLPAAEAPAVTPSS